MKRLFILLCSVFLSVQVFASNKTLTPEVTLKNIQAIKTLEKRDELYLAVTEFPSEGLPSHFQVPKFPMFWPSTHLDKVVDFKIWARKLKPGSSVTLILALIDKDAPPWNTDDLIGEVKVHIKNDGGKLISSWRLPNRDDASDVLPTNESREGQFDLKAEKAHYKVTFAIK